MTTPQRPFFSIGLSFAGLVDVGVMLSMVSVWLGLFGSVHWTLDLFSHFRWQYLLLCVLSLLWCLLFRRPKLVLFICAASFLFNGFEIYRVSGESRFSETVGARLRVVSLNVYVGNEEKVQVLDYLRSTDADVIFLFEVDDAWTHGLEPLRTLYPYQVVEARSDGFGVAFLSRMPLKDAQTFYAGPLGVPSVQAYVQHAGREWGVVGTHPIPPINGPMALARDTQLSEIAEHAVGMNGPVLVMGDFNATPWSYGVRVLKERGLEYRSVAPAWKPTWQASTIFAIPIDLALCTAPLVIAKREIGPDVGSDHRGQLIEVGWEN
jgi:endonuclease/exonuclease/phosphatase (EEP) superfamily protein YafD